MNFQLVLQFSSFALKNFDEIAELEDLLIAKLKSQNVVDGHDLGVGEVNVFIFTDEPNGTFREIQSILTDHRLWPHIRAGYSAEYVVLWPEGHATFSVR
jgi:hypothetical protein